MYIARVGIYSSTGPTPLISEALQAAKDSILLQYSMRVAPDNLNELKGLWITSVVRCAPPGNKPSPEEIRNCSPWVDQEMALLKNLRVVVCLGRIAFDGLIAYEQRRGKALSRSSYPFAHGAEYTLPSGLVVLASYHPSLQNTNTGKLTRPMFLDVFMRARYLAGLT